jgi:hypothetical protein
MSLYTPEDLLRYLYKETAPEETAAIEAALKQDWSLREKLEVIRVSGERLDKIIESPRQELVQHILNYAKSKSATVQP